MAILTVEDLEPIPNGFITSRGITFLQNPGGVWVINAPAAGHLGSAGSLAEALEVYNAL